MIVKKFEDVAWRYSIFNDRHFGIVIAKNESDAKRRLYNIYYDEAADYQDNAKPSAEHCDISLWSITDDEYYSNGVFETS